MIAHSLMHAAEMSEPTPYYCMRCGMRTFYGCVHPMGMSTPMAPDRAVRVRARYVLGKAFDPANHDVNDYYTEAALPSR